jgi:hypothetical protein
MNKTVTMKHVCMCHKCSHGIFEDSKCDIGAKIMAGCKLMSSPEFVEFSKTPMIERGKFCPAMNRRMALVDLIKKS